MWFRHLIISIKMSDFVFVMLFPTSFFPWLLRNLTLKTDSYLLITKANIQHDWMLEWKTNSLAEKKRRWDTFFQSFQKENILLKWWIFYKLKKILFLWKRLSNCLKMYDSLWIFYFDENQTSCQRINMI